MGEQTETSTNWSEFKEELKAVWTDLKDGDLEDTQESLEDLVDRIQAVTEETRDEVKSKVEDLLERFNISLTS